MTKNIAQDIKLPDIKIRMPKPKRLSMDDYLKFVEFNLKYTVDIKEARRQKRRNAVDSVFSF